jgi:hypothetical protein
MNYSDRMAPINGIVRSKYSDLEDTTNYNCDQTCLCRHTGERSVKDKMYYDWFVLNKPVQMPLASNTGNMQMKNTNQK